MCILLYSLLYLLCIFFSIIYFNSLYSRIVFILRLAQSSSVIGNNQKKYVVFSINVCMLFYFILQIS